MKLKLAIFTIAILAIFAVPVTYAADWSTGPNWILGENWLSLPDPSPSLSPSPVVTLQINTMNSTSLVMFAIVFVLGFVSTFLSLGELREIFARKKGSAEVGLIYSVFATVIWMIMGIIWPAVSTADMWVALAYLWYALMFCFFFVDVVFVSLIVKASAKPEGARLEIQEAERY